MANKATQAEMIIRVSEVKDQLLAGVTRCDIIRLGSNWGIGDRQVDDLISMARKEILEANHASYEENRALVLRNLWSLYNANKSADDRQGMLKCISEVVRVTGLSEIRISHLVEKLEGVEASTLEADVLSELTEIRH